MNDCVERFIGCGIGVVESCDIEVWIFHSADPAGFVVGPPDVVVIAVDFLSDLALLSGYVTCCRCDFEATGKRSGAVATSRQSPYITPNHEVRARDARALP